MRNLEVRHVYHSVLDSIMLLQFRKQHLPVRQPVPHQIRRLLQQEGSGPLVKDDLHEHVHSVPLVVLVFPLLFHFGRFGERLARWPADDDVCIQDGWICCQILADGGQLVPLGNGCNFLIVLVPRGGKSGTLEPDGQAATAAKQIHALHLRLQAKKKWEQ